jgi:hypothetical protein
VTSLRAILLVLGLLSSLVEYLRKRGALSEAEAVIIKAHLESAHAEVEEADSVRRDVRAGVAADPGRLRPLTTLFAAPQAPEPISHASFCEIARPITWADGDTDATLAQIQEHNAVGVKLCGWGNP